MNKDQEITETYQELLSRVEEVNPEVAEALRRKYQEEEESFSKAAKDALPSADPKYWAKSSCTKCYGRGTRGTLQQFAGPAKKGMPPAATNSLKCPCTLKNYKKWLVNFRESYIAAKAAEGDSNAPTDTNTRSEDTTQAL